MRHLGLLVRSLIVVLGLAFSGWAQSAPVTDEGQLIKNFSLVMNSGSYEEKNNAILDLSWPKSERAAKTLLRRLKQNLSNHRGAQERPWTQSSSGMIVWGSDPSENQLLITALAKQGYASAVPTLLKMFQMKQERRGITAQNLAYYVNQITGDAVVYEENGEKKRFPAPATTPQ